MNRLGVDKARELVAMLAHGWDMVVPAILRDHAKDSRNFAFRLVRSKVEHGIATLTVDRPDAMNALNETVVAQLTRAFRAAEQDPDVRGIVIAGTGKAFIAGADIRFFVDNIERGDMERIVSFTRAGHDLLAMIDGCPKPVVARMHGLALGGGLELALACDRIVATPKAALAFPETGIGIYPGLGGTQRAPRRVGPGLAKWLIYTGQMLTAEEAKAIGLVDAVVPFEELDAAVVEAMRAGKADRPPLSGKHAALEAFFAAHPVEELLAGAPSAEEEPVAKASARVKQKAPIALRLAERLIDLSESTPLEDGLAEELRHLVEIFSTEDAKLGLSTVGKRAPSFAGR
jgi:enoyl-CoA hydratase/3-hydroxyacyl-CoA dehydrogenase